MNLLYALIRIALVLMQKILICKEMGCFAIYCEVDVCLQIKDGTYGLITPTILNPWTLPLQRAPV